MPKRERTPSPSEDEPKYFTVNYPYPAHANMELVDDRVRLAQWIGCVVNPDKFISIFHKPSSPNMVILEIEKDCQEIPLLLGAHKWSEFLRKPSPDEMDIESRVFYCHFTKGREVQKYGWKRVDVKEEWFMSKNWNRKNDKCVQYPYPATYYCDLPSENQTGYRLCRPLPKEVKAQMVPVQLPKPKPPPPAPVGSEAWAKQRQTSAPTPAKTKKPTNNPRSASEPLLLTTVIPSYAEPEPPKSKKKKGKGRGNGIVATSPNDLKTKLEYPPLTPCDSSTTSQNSSLISNGTFAPPPGLTPPLPIKVDAASKGPDFETDEMRAVREGMEGASLGDDEVQEDLWAKSEPLDAPKDDEGDTFLCPDHNVICKKGICATYGKLKSRQKWEKKMKDRAEAALQRKKVPRGTAHTKRNEPVRDVPVSQSRPGLWAMWSGKHDSTTQAVQEETADAGDSGPRAQSTNGGASGGDSGWANDGWGTIVQEPGVEIDEDDDWGRDLDEPTVSKVVPPLGSSEPNEDGWGASVGDGTADNSNNNAVSSRSTRSNPKPPAPSVKKHTEEDEDEDGGWDQDPDAPKASNVVESWETPEPDEEGWGVVGGSSSRNKARSNDNPWGAQKQGSGAGGRGQGKNSFFKSDAYSYPTTNTSTRGKQFSNGGGRARGGRGGGGGGGGRGRGFFKSNNQFASGSDNMNLNAYNSDKTSVASSGGELNLTGDYDPKESWADE